MDTTEFLTDISEYSDREIKNIVKRVCPSFVELPFYKITEFENEYNILDFVDDFIADAFDEDEDLSANIFQYDLEDELIMAVYGIILYEEGYDVNDNVCLFPIKMWRELYESN